MKTLCILLLALGGLVSVCGAAPRDGIPTAKAEILETGNPGDPGDPLLVGDCTDYVDLSGMPLPINVAGTTVGGGNSYGPYPAYPACFRGTWYPLSGAGPDRT